jgi:hypothetical protein
MEVEMKGSFVLKLVSAALVAAASGQVAFAAPDNLPAVHHQGDVAYLSGGVGLGQSTAIKGVMNEYPLTLEFAGKASSGNEYLADIPVQITDLHGHVLLNATAKGPFLLASLPDGRYQVSATYNGQIEHRSVDIAKSTHTHEVFLWSM